MSRNAHCGSSKTYATYFAMGKKLISTLSSLNPDVPHSSSSSSSKAACAGHPQVRGLGNWSYPVCLAFEQRCGLVEHLLEGLLLGDALGEGRSVGVDLGLTVRVSEDAHSVGSRAGHAILSFSPFSFSPRERVRKQGQTLLLDE